MDSGTAVLAVILGVAVMAFVVEEVIRYQRKRALRAAYRPCARCGMPVKRGELDCPHCGFDFRTIGEPPPAL